MRGYADYAVSGMIVLLAVLLFLFMERRCVVGKDPKENFASKNNFGTLGIRDELKIVQGGGNYPFVF